MLIVRFILSSIMNQVDIVNEWFKDMEQLAYLYTHDLDNSCCVYWALELPS